MSDWRRGFHFSGGNDVSAWSADGSQLLNLRSSQLPHDVAPIDSATIGYIPFSTGIPSHMTAYVDVNYPSAFTAVINPHMWGAHYSSVNCSRLMAVLCMCCICNSAPVG